MSKGKIVAAYEGPRESTLRFALRLLGLDGGPGSGNFGHAGRPGKVGGSSNGEGGGSAPEEGNAPETPERSGKYFDQIRKKREISRKWPENRKAEYAFEHGLATEEEAIDAMNNGTAQSLLDRYFDILEKNGDPTPTKEKRKSPDLNDEVIYQKKWSPSEEGKRDEFTVARLSYIRDWTGCSEEEAERTLDEMGTWFSGRWGHADTKTLDKYIDDDGVYDGEIYRGIALDQKEYEDLMAKSRPGGTVRMIGRNSSWTSDKEMACRFAGSDEAYRHVVFKCVANRTAAPVSHLSTHGEDEVLAHSRAQWTVLAVQEGRNRTVITVIESADRMSEEERDRLRAAHDSAPEIDEKYEDLAGRMNAQQKYFEVVPPPMSAADGGPGSGNWGHRGRPGKVGGSGKGSGGSAFRSGSKESGYTSFARHQEFKGILGAAKEAKNINSFRGKLTDEQWDAIYEQYESVGTGEDLDSYTERLFKMINHDRPEKSAPKKWYDGLSDEDKSVVDRLEEEYESFGAALGKHWNGTQMENIVDAAAKATNWSEKILDRGFENLSDEEKKDLNAILDSFPWGDGPKYSKIPNEDFIRQNGESGLNKYFTALKAKEIGIEDVELPPKPKGLEYLEKHGRFKEVFQAQDGGYVHTDAGDKFRSSVKDKLKKSNCFIEVSSGTENGVSNGSFVAGYRKAIIDSIDHMDDRVAELVDRTIDKARVSWIDENGTSNFDGSQIHMFAQRCDGTPRSAEDIVSTFWHEYGHYCDSWVSNSGVKFNTDPLEYHSTKDGATALAIHGDEYKRAAEKDIQGLLELAGLGDQYFAQAVDYGQHVGIRRKSDGAWVDGKDIGSYDIVTAVDRALKDQIGYKEWENFLTDRGCPVEPKFKDYYKTYTTPKRQTVKTRPIKKGYDEKYAQAMDEYRQKREAWENSLGEEKYRELLRQRDQLYKDYEARREKLGNVTDCIDDAVQGMFFLGAVWGAHTIDYYEKKKWPIETAANIFSIRATNDREVVDFMNALIPNISQTMTKAWRCGDDERD